MSSVKYEFRYMPLIGKLSGESMLQQTETAINEIAEIVNENTAQADIINTLAQDANDNSVEALEKANGALETSSRVYIHESLAVNLDSYCESQLIYVANISSTNLPIAKKGFLEVKTDDDKTECVQLFVSDDKDVYVRSGSITAETVGDTTVYTADFEEWTSLSSPTILLQAGSGTSIPLSADLNNYNTEGTFYCSTTNVGSIAHCPVSEGEFKLIVMKFATANYGLQMLYPIGKHLYVRKYSSGAWGNWEVIVPKITSGVTNGSIAVNDTDVAVTGWNTKADLDSPVFVGTPTAPTPASSDNSTKLATTEFVNTKAGDYLPLSGGTMTGTTVYDTMNAIARNSTSDELVIYGGAVSNSNPCISLRCKERANEAGSLYIRIQDNSYTKVMLLKPDGTFTWGGNSVLTASNYSNYALPLSGGTLTGQTTFNTRTKFKSSIDFFESDVEHGRIYDNTNILRITGGTSTSDGSYLDLSYTGGGTQQFRIVANDGTIQKALVGKPDGTLTWDGNNIALAKDYLPLSGGTITGVIKSSVETSLARSSNDASIVIAGGSSWSNGAYLSLSGKDRQVNAGAFVLQAVDGSNNVQFLGKPDGTLTWNGERVSVQPKLLWNSKDGITNGATINIPEAVNYSTFLITASADMTDSYGSSLTFMVSRFFNAEDGIYNTSGSVRGGTPICMGDDAFRIIGFNGSINSSGVLSVGIVTLMVLTSSGITSYANRKIYAVFGLHRV